MIDKPGERFVPGQRVTVTQQIPQRNEVWTTRVTGRVVRFQQRATGSWFAHSKDCKLWLDRLMLRKDDGEIVECVLDPYTHVDVLEVAVPAANSVGEPQDQAVENEAVE